MYLGDWLIYTAATVLSLYLFWRYAKEEGFVIEQIFDIYIFTFLGIFLGDRFFGLEGAVLGGFFFFYMFVKRKNWSVDRVGDLFSIPLCLGLVIVFLGILIKNGNWINLFVLGTLIFLLSLLIYLKNAKLFGISSRVFRVARISAISFSGGLFYTCLISLSLVGMIFYSEGKIEKYVFYLVILLSLLVSFLHRVRSELKMKRTLSKEFLKTIKEKLLRRQKRLVSQNLRLKREDPYMQPGRENENAEYVEDAQEDIGHTRSMLSLMVVNKARMQVAKALARIKHRKYGVCEKCGKPIDPARLKAYPEATLCVECARREK